MELTPKHAMVGAVSAAALTAQTSPELLNLPPVPYAWMTLAAYGAWQARTGWERLAAGRTPRGRRRKNRYQGTASAVELHRRLSARAVRRHGSRTRPMLDVRAAEVTEVGVAIGRVHRWSPRLFGTAEDSYLLVAPPRTGKTGWMAGAVLDAPGAVVATSTRVDLHTHTALTRADRGPVWVLNPDDMGAVPSTLRWSPLVGCHLPGEAMQRAGYLLDATGSGGDGKDAFWSGQAHTLLRLMLHAAALAEGDLRDVYRWVSHPDNPAPLAILAHHPHAATGWADELADLLEAPDGTLGSIARTAAGALAWLSDPALEHAACPPVGEEFDATSFLLDGGTLYLIGADRPHASMAPYVACLTAFLFEHAKRLAARSPGARLDPPLTLALDEAAIICPVPLERWSAEAGGHGVTVLAAVQSIAQLHDRWGEPRAKTIWNNATVKLVFGGFTDAAELEAVSAICGHHDVVAHAPRRLPATGGDREQRPAPVLRTERVLPPERLRLLPPGRALLLHRTTRPAIVCLSPVWDRPDYRPAPPPQAPIGTVPALTPRGPLPALTAASPTALTAASAPAPNEGIAS
ncbi:type IV secretory system conjugative DNA transfer family protein [Actinomadura hibisca]|uniref:type IV secretory system conjugative DNA transfer family protein n=1 Tax=Actinomadura hibisca TaxID=68565 RepID=UPI0008295F80|nr:TraM recognition domain-containing protein [Actinomadura hibisca]